MQRGNDIKSKVAAVQPVGLGCWHRRPAGRHRRLRGPRPALGPADKAGLKKGPVVQIPTVLGAITISYNLKGVKSGMFLDGPTIANIYLGKIKVERPRDPEAEQEDQASEHRDHRRPPFDPSGTTKGFTTFLAAYSNEWKTKVGVDKTVNWPTGTGAEKNSGVAAAVKQKGGSVGYVEQPYALQNHFTYANVKNAMGKFIA
jgi:phosphate transport system substrate-binding protein